MDTNAGLSKPRGALEVVDAATDALRRRPRDVALVMAIVVIPVIGFSLITGIEDSGGGSGSGNTFQSIFTDEGDVDYSLVVASLAVQSLLFSFVTFALTRMIVGEILGETVLPGRALRSAFLATPTLVALWLLVHAAELLGLIGLVVGSIIVMSGLMVTVPALASEPGLTAVGAFRRSWRLTDGVRGRVFAVLLVLLLINTTLTIVLVLAPVSLFDLITGGRTLWVIGVGFDAMASVVTQAIAAGATVYTYLDLRVRREGLDIDLRLQNAL